jgi:hypothetical protein
MHNQKIDHLAGEEDVIIASFISTDSQTHNPSGITNIQIDRHTIDTTPHHTTVHLIIRRKWANQYYILDHGERWVLYLRCSHNIHNTTYRTQHKCHIFVY